MPRGPSPVLPSESPRRRPNADLNGSFRSAFGLFTSRVRLGLDSCENANETPPIVRAQSVRMKVLYYYVPVYTYTVTTVPA